MNITCDLYSEWINAIRREFTKAGFVHQSMSDRDCAILWQSWNRRLIPAKPRLIKKACSFSCPPTHQKGLEALEAVFEKGDDIKPWQSRMTEKIEFEDGLLNDYGVLHFHLGDTFDNSGFIKRTGPLLFAIVRDDTVYAIGIYNHGDWYELDILNIIDRNWPNLLNPVTVKGFDAAYTPKSREEIKALRNSNVCAVISLDSGRMVAPLGGGIATDGTSNDAVHSADHWAKYLRNADNMIIDHIKECVRKGTMPAKDYIVHLHATDSEIAGVIDGIQRIDLWRKNA